MYACKGGEERGCVCMYVWGGEGVYSHIKITEMLFILLRGQNLSTGKIEKDYR